MGIYLLILAIKNEKNYLWILLPVVLGFGFLSKQVPSFYIILSTFLILIYYSLIKKKYKWIRYTILSTSFFIFFLIIFFSFQKISLSSFLEQYIFYPQTIGGKRFSNFNFTFNGIIGHFKFIYIALIPLIYVNFKKLFIEKDYYKKNSFIFFLILFVFTFSLITHQMLTRNQTFIFFLIPILTAFSHIYINSDKRFFVRVTYNILFICYD